MLDLAFAPAVFNGDVLSVNVAEFAHPLDKFLLAWVGVGE
jgi:hypothetical protein